MSLLEKHTRRFAEYLAAHPFQGKPETLYEPMNYIMELGGKRIRPALVLLATESAGGNAEAVLPLALGIETFHNFSLLHDDIMDAAPLRRGKPTVHKKWNEAVAILAGDNMLVEATRFMALHGDKEGHILGFFLQTAREVCEGQQMDMDFQQRDDVSEAEYLEMIRLKTAVLLGCAMYAGAVAAGTADATAVKMYDFAIDAGMGFQLQDDLLDTFGDPVFTGKQAGGDILAGKKTLLWIEMWSKATPEQRREIQSLMADPDESKKVNGIRHLMTLTGAEARVRELSESYFEQAALLLHDLDSEGLDMTGPAELLAFLRGRQH
jgi:geranylgeranyl diphosphate synthase type II